MRVYLTMPRCETCKDAQRRRRRALCAAFGLLAGVACAQEPVQSSAPTLRANSTLVAVPVLVSTHTGEPVFNLSVDDFLLTDDGVPQRLTLEEDTVGQPVALVVVLEAGAATAGAGWHPLRHAAPTNRFETLPTMIEALTGERRKRVAVVGFDSAPELLLDFTDDPGPVAQTIHEFSDSEGDRGAAILDSVGFALELLARQPAGFRRAILLVSETEDRGSRLPLQAALRRVGDTNTVIYSVAYSTGKAAASHYGQKELPTKRISPPGSAAGADASSAVAPAASPAADVVAAFASALIAGVALGNPNPNPAGGCMSRKDDSAEDAAQNTGSRALDCLGQLAPPLALAKMAGMAALDGLRLNTPRTVAQLTGGEYFSFNDARSLEYDLATIANHLHNRYLLSFQPQRPHPGFHALSLNVRDGRKLDIAARTGYWAETTGR